MFSNKSKEVSKQNQKKIYEKANGQLAFDGVFFKNQKELENYILLITKPPKLFKFIMKILTFIFVRKKEDREKLKY